MHPYLGGNVPEGEGYTHTHTVGDHALDDHHHNLIHFPHGQHLHAQVGNDYNDIFDSILTKYIKDYKPKVAKRKDPFEHMSTPLTSPTYSGYTYTM